MGHFGKFLPPSPTFLPNLSQPPHRGMVPYIGTIWALDARLLRTRCCVGMGLKSTDWGFVPKKGVDWESFPWDKQSSANETRQRINKIRTKNKKMAGSYRHLIRRYKEIRRVDEQTSPPGSQRSRTPQKWDEGGGLRSGSFLNPPFPFSGVRYAGPGKLGTVNTATLWLI